MTEIKTIPVRMTKDMHFNLKKLSLLTEKSMSNLAEEGINKVIDEYKKSVGKLELSF